VLTGMRVDLKTLTAIFSGVQIMHPMTAYDEAVYNGELRGRLQIILRQCMKRFGEPDAATERALRAIPDLDRLDRMADSMLTATN